MASVVIVNEEDVRVWQRWRRFALAGWVVAGLVGLALFWALGARRAYQDNVGRLDLLIKRVDVVSGLQERDREALVTAWSSLQRTTDSVLEMGTYLQERKKLVDYNAAVVERSRK